MKCRWLPLRKITRNPLPQVKDQPAGVLLLIPELTYLHLKLNSSINPSWISLYIKKRLPVVCLEILRVPLILMMFHPELMESPLTSLRVLLVLL